MKSYPTISTKIKRTNVWTFDKLDGSNIRAEWSSKKGFYKFGSRNQLINESHYPLGEAITLLYEKTDLLGSIFMKHKWERVVAFFEFYGLHSFAGFHEDEEHKITLIDISIYKKGMLEPQQFVNTFEEVGIIPKILHIGMVNEQLITDVKRSALNNMTFEGVVCKYTENNRVKMFKVKSLAWLNKLRDKCGNNEALFRRLR